MTDFVRYAVYYTPPPGSELARFGASWLGRALDGEELRALPHGLDPNDLSAITASPRRYGFHGTIKAPFRVVPHAGRDDLLDGLKSIAASEGPAECGPLALTSIGPFLALCPTGDQSGLGRLAERVVRELDHLRPPLSDAERARRHPDRLTARQRSQLDAFGYPYIFEDFRFHLTLTGPLEDDLHARIKSILEPLTRPYCHEPFVVPALTVLGDPGDGAPFEVVERVALKDRPDTVRAGDDTQAVTGA